MSIFTGGNLSGPVRAAASHGDAHQDPLLAHHGRAVVVPVGVLAGDAAVVGDETVHRLGQVHDLGRAFHLRPFAEEAVVEHADRDVRLPLEVLHLHCGLAGAHDDTTVVVDVTRDRRHRGPAV